MILMIVMHGLDLASLMDWHFKVIHAKDLLKEKESTNWPKDQGDCRVFTIT
jgi:hypothetical protein